MWRSSFIRNYSPLTINVFSTYVEVILMQQLSATGISSILHVCGGHPSIHVECQNTQQYSPRMWRSSLKVFAVLINECVFSTYVEVILNGVAIWQFCDSILHVCGGHPMFGLTAKNGKRYSPRMWRSSSQGAGQPDLEYVFSTYVEVIPTQLPIALS